MNGTEPHAARARLLVQVDEAARVIAPLWPLATSVAVNPLWDLRQMSFENAIAHAARALGISGYPSAALLAEAYASGRITAADLRAAIEDRSVFAASRSNGLEGGSATEPLLTATEPLLTATEPLLTATERYDFVFDTWLAATTDREVAKWCGAYLAGMLPATEGGFYPAWRTVVASDPAARRIVGKAGRERLAHLPARPEEAVLACLDRLGIPDEDRASELARQLGRMPGWAGHAKWRSRWAAPDHPGPALHLVDYLAVRLGYEAELLAAATDRQLRPPGRSIRTPLPNRRNPQHRDPQHRDPQRRDPQRRDLLRRPVTLCEPGSGLSELDGLPDDLRGKLSDLSATDVANVWFGAYERHYRDWLLAALDARTALPDAHADVPQHVPNHAPQHVPQHVDRAAPPTAQVVCCIDVRSEGLRRHLEATGAYETFGFAGFFGLPVRYQPFGSAETVDLCPVLLRPSTEMEERPSRQSDPVVDRQVAGRQALHATGAMFDSARKAAVSSFILAEAGGFVAGPVAAAKTLVPARYAKLRAWTRRKLAPSAATTVDADPAHGVMSDDAQALFAETALTTMGLTGNFSPVVLLCGHGSTTENNPYGSSLDCGACGGNRGGASARAAAAILNRATTRRLLAQRNIVIPDGTVFVAGEHDTATDTVTIFDPHLIPPSHRAGVAKLQDDLGRAGAALAAERTRRLPGARRRSPMAEVAARSADWAQVQPEWGLARNAAFIVAPRQVTTGVDLACRCFLHSYDAGVDPDGVALETILTAPMVVAHWINAQYYFSTVDPGVLSAGDKTAHNIVAGIGVIGGAAGDLQVGLPVQSLFDAGQAYHEPMRLLTVVQAPQTLLQAVIARNPVLRELFDGQWVHLVARDDERDTWKIRHPGGTWTCWTPTATHTMETTSHG